jgi:hypothetical protein
MKLVTIVIRGVVFRVSAKTARELQKFERKLIQKEWNNNQLAE